MLQLGWVPFDCSFALFVHRFHRHEKASPHSLQKPPILLVRFICWLAGGYTDARGSVGRVHINYTGQQTCPNSSHESLQVDRVYINYMYQQTCLIVSSQETLQVDRVYINYTGQQICPNSSHESLQVGRVYINHNVITKHVLTVPRKQWIAFTSTIYDMTTNLS